MVWTRGPGMACILDGSIRPLARTFVTSFRGAGLPGHVPGFRYRPRKPREPKAEKPRAGVDRGQAEDSHLDAEAASSPSPTRESTWLQASR